MLCCRIPYCLLTVLLLLNCPHGAADATDLSNAAQTLTLRTRIRTETAAGSGRWHSEIRPVEWNAGQTAIVVCDMWDRHWCDSATARVTELVPRMNDVIRSARQKGVLIIHCPSGTMDFYRDTPQRRLAQSAPVVETPVPLETWCPLDPQREGDRLPIDDSDGGCDCDAPAGSFRAWTRQHPALEIAAGDAITDSAEAFFLMKQRGIVNVIVMGVHTNMCVLGRPFSIRQLVRQGQNVVLMRDLTDTMYNPARAPYVSHFTGNDLVAEHIEQYWCPTITSTEFLGGQPFRFAADRRPHLVIVSSEPEYRTEVSLPRFAREHLGKEFRVSLVFGDAADDNLLPGLEVLRTADMVLVSIRRRTLQPDQLQIFRDFVAQGKPVMGIRTASHAFCLRDNAVPADRAVWPEFDRDVIGGNYRNHWGAGPKTAVSLASPAAADHPILKGVHLAQLSGNGSLYQVSPLQESAEALLIGTIPDVPSEPIAWLNRRADGGLTFYTSLGHIDDFSEEPFRQLLTNAVTWLSRTSVDQPDDPTP